MLASNLKKPGTNLEPQSHKGRQAASVVPKNQPQCEKSLLFLQHDNQIL